MRSEIRVAARDGSVGVLVGNLRGRPGLGSALARAGVVEGAPPDAVNALADVASHDVLDGDHELAVALLTDTRIACRTAEKIAGSPYAAGLAFVADVLSGRIAVPDASRAALAAFDMNLGDIRGTRPLDAERRVALLRVAREDPDPALRVAAAWFELPIGETVPEERWDAADAWMLAVLRDALAKFPEGAVKDRMAALLQPE